MKNMISLVKFIFCMFLVTINFLGSVSQHDGDLSEEELREFIQHKQWYEKACILQHNNDTIAVKTYLDAVRRLKNDMKKITVQMKFHIEHDETITSAVIRCYLKRSEPAVYHLADSNGSKYSKDKKSKKLCKWLKTMLFGNHDNELQFIDSIEIARWIEGRNKNDATIMLCVPGSYHLSRMEHIFTNVKTSYPDSSVYFVPPGTDVEHLVVEEFLIENFPTVIFFHRPAPSTPFKRHKTLGGEYEATEQLIQMTLLLQNKLKKISMEKQKFETHIRNVQYYRKPSLITVFSSVDARAYNYLHALYRSFESHGSLADFFVFDISKQDNMLALTKHLELYRINSVPFTFCLHRNISGDHQVIEQTLLETNGTPTPHVVNVFFKRLGNRDNDTRRLYGFVENQCLSNKTNICELSDQSDEEKKTLRRSRWKQKKRLQRRGKLEELTDSKWERNVLGYNKPNDLDAFTENIDFDVKLSLVIFIHGDCSYCEKVMSEFQNVARSAVYIENLSVFLMNCSKSNTNKCKDYHVTGYPTLLLFRTIEAENSERCFHPDDLVEPSWIDYHGNFKASEILDWVSRMKTPTMNIQSSVSNVFKKKNIKLVIKLFTKKYVADSLPRSLNGKILHLSCLSILCEKLHSQLECIGVGETGLKVTSSDKNLFVSSIEFWREDGIRAVLMRTSFPMEHTISMEDKESRNRVFHEPHQYNIPPGFSCEDDHRRCIDVIKHFISDHSRPPITHVTQEMFHTHKKGTSYMWHRPVLLALAHQSNLTTGSKFYEDLYKAALQLYKKVNVATLDVDQHTHWAAMFVPRGYYMKYQGTSKILPLDRYPRFCLIHLDNHSQVAFYPRFNNALAEGDDFQGHVSGMLNVEEILSFVDDYLKHGNDFTVESEHF